MDVKNQITEKYPIFAQIEEFTKTHSDKKDNVMNPALQLVYILLSNRDDNGKFDLRLFGAIEDAELNPSLWLMNYAPSPPNINHVADMVKAFVGIPKDQSIGGYVLNNLQHPNAHRRISAVLKSVVYSYITNTWHSGDIMNMLLVEAPTAIGRDAVVFMLETLLINNDSSFVLHEFNPFVKKMPHLKLIVLAVCVSQKQAWDKKFKQTGDYLSRQPSFIIHPEVINSVLEEAKADPSAFFDHDFQHEDHLIPAFTALVAELEDKQVIEKFISDMIKLYPDQIVSMVKEYHTGFFNEDQMEDIRIILGSNESKYNDYRIYHPDIIHGYDEFRVLSSHLSSSEIVNFTHGLMGTDPVYHKILNDLARKGFNLEKIYMQLLEDKPNLVEFLPHGILNNAEFLQKMITYDSDFKFTIAKHLARPVYTLAQYIESKELPGYKPIVQLEEGDFEIINPDFSPGIKQTIREIKINGIDNTYKQLGFNRNLRPFNDLIKYCPIYLPWSVELLSKN